MKQRIRIMALLLCTLFLFSGCDDLEDESNGFSPVVENEEEENKDAEEAVEKQEEK